MLKPRTASLGNQQIAFLFEDYALDTSRRELRRGAELIPLEPKVFDLLVYLIQHRERVVNLCWRYGERAVEFWHGMDEGFAQRKPLA